MDVFQDCLVKPRTDEQYLSKTVNDRTRVIAFITASRIIIPASGVWYERFCFLTCDTLGAQIKIPVRGVSRISRESRVVSILSHCSLGERKVPGFCGWQALLFRITMKSSAFEGPHTVLSYDPSHAHRYVFRVLRWDFFLVTHDPAAVCLLLPGRQRLKLWLCSGSYLFP